MNNCHCSESGGKQNRTKEEPKSQSHWYCQKFCSPLLQQVCLVRHKSQRKSPLSLQCPRISLVFTLPLLFWFAHWHSVVCKHMCHHQLCSQMSLCSTYCSHTACFIFECQSHESPIFHALICPFSLVTCLPLSTLSLPHFITHSFTLVSGPII